MSNKLNWSKYPAISANRSFYVVTVNNHRWSVVYYFSGLWTCLIDDCIVDTYKSKSDALDYFQRVFDAL